MEDSPGAESHRGAHSPRKGTGAETGKIGNDGFMDSSPEQKCHASLKPRPFLVPMFLFYSETRLVMTEGVFCNLELIISASSPHSTTTTSISCSAFSSSCPG